MAGDAKGIAGPAPPCGGGSRRPRTGILRAGPGEHARRTRASTPPRPSPGLLRRRMLPEPPWHQALGLAQYCAGRDKWAILTILNLTHLHPDWIHLPAVWPVLAGLPSHRQRRRGGEVAGEDPGVAATSTPRFGATRSPPAPWSDVASWIDFELLAREAEADLDWAARPPDELDQDRVDPVPIVDDLEPRESLADRRATARSPSTTASSRRAPPREPRRWASWEFMLPVSPISIRRWSSSIRK